MNATAADAVEHRAAERAVAVAGHARRLTATEAVELADTLCAAAELPRPSPLDRRLAADLEAAADADADADEHRAGVA